MGFLPVSLIFLCPVRLPFSHLAALSRTLIALLVDDLHPCVEPGLNVIGNTERPGRGLVDQRPDARGEILGVAGIGGDVLLRQKHAGTVGGCGQHLEPAGQRLKHRVGTGVIKRRQDEQMAALSRLGNDYRPTSAYERGQRYASRLQNEFAGNISALADAENISRKIITRCINTAKLPKSVVALFSHPGELSARSGDVLQKAFTDKEELLKQQASNLHEKKKAGVIFEAEEVITLLTSVLKTSSASRTNLSSRHQFAPGATVLYKGDKMVLNLDRSRVPTECIDKIEAILKTLEKPGT